VNRNVPAIPRDGRHRYALRIYYEDTDAGGIVYHANYLRFAERARTEALRDMGIPHAEMTERFGLMFVVRKVDVDYLRAARLDDSVVVETSALEVGGATVLLRQDVIAPAGLCARLVVRLACVRPGENKPGRMPPRWRSALAALCDAGRMTEAGKGIECGSGS
jgi:acyl-CoA thioester hydrolase